MAQEVVQRKRLATRRRFDFRLKYQGRGRTIPGSFEAAKAKKARQTQRKKKEAWAWDRVLEHVTTKHWVH